MNNYKRDLSLVLVVIAIVLFILLLGILMGASLYRSHMINNAPVVEQQCTTKIKDMHGAKHILVGKTIVDAQQILIDNF